MNLEEYRIRVVQKVLPDRKQLMDEEDSLPAI